VAHHFGSGVTACHLPLYVYCGEQLLVSYLRPSKIDGAKHAWAILAQNARLNALTQAHREHLAVQFAATICSKNVQPACSHAKRSGAAPKNRSTPVPVKHAG
jgi:hypothetical protein